MSTTLTGYTCIYCGSWVGPSESHWCERMHPNWTPEWTATRIDPNAPGGPLDRIATALERIATVLEAKYEEISNYNKEWNESATYTPILVSLGVCGLVSADGRYACIKNLGHDGPHGG